MSSKTTIWNCHVRTSHFHKLFVRSGKNPKFIQGLSRKHKYCKRNMIAITTVIELLRELSERSEFDFETRRLKLQVRGWHVTPSLMNTRPPPTLASAAVPSTPCIFISISNYPSLDLVTAGFCSYSIIFAQHCLTWWSNPSRRPYWSVPLPPLHHNPPPTPKYLRGTWGVDSSLRTVSPKRRQWFKTVF